MPRPPVRPLWQTTDCKTVRLYCGDVLDVLRKMPDRSVQMVVTSPPYWGLRDYGTATWEGGDPSCDHKQTTARHDGGRVQVDGFHGSAAKDSDKGAMNFRDTCGKCGARRIDAQLGLEPTPAEYVAKMVEVFREVRRVLRDDGTLWLNMGSSYYSGGQQDRSHGTDDTALLDWSGDDSLATRPYDEHQDSFSTRNVGSETHLSPLSAGDASAQTPESTASVSPYPESSDSDHRQPSVQSSRAKPDLKTSLSLVLSQQLASRGRPKSRRSSSQPLGVSSLSTRASTSPSSPQSFSSDAQESERNSAYTSGISLKSLPSAGRRSGKESFVSACRSPLCQGLGRCGLCWARLSIPYFKPGDEINTPHLVALALQADGWILRQTICWHKPASMPESVKNRCTKAHEYLFLLTKKLGYYYDAEAIRQPLSSNSSGCARPRGFVGGGLGQSSKGLRIADVGR